MHFGGCSNEGLLHWWRKYSPVFGKLAILKFLFDVTTFEESLGGTFSGYDIIDRVMTSLIELWLELWYITGDWS